MVQAVAVSLCCHSLIVLACSIDQTEGSHISYNPGCKAQDKEDSRSHGCRILILI